MNPFRFEMLIGRTAEVKELIAHARDRQIVSIAAPRRYGKTSLLRAAGQQLGERHKFLVAHVDLLGLAGPSDFAARFGSAWRRAVETDRVLRRDFERLTAGLASFGVTLLGSGVQVSRRDPDHSDALTLVHALLDLPGDCAKPVLVVLDEFQALHDAWPDGEGVLRSHSQSPKQAGKVAYAFAGSEPSLLEAAFADHGRAYYQQVVQLPLGRLSNAELADGISGAFREGGKDAGTALGRLVAVADGHPQRAMLLAHLLWEATRPGRAADETAWDQALTRARALTQDEARAIWESLTPAQRAALQAVVEHGSAHSVRGDQTVARASRQTAGELLARRGLVELDSARGPLGGKRYHLVDPLLDDWIRQRRS